MHANDSHLNTERRAFESAVRSSKNYSQPRSLSRDNLFEHPCPQIFLILHIQQPPSNEQHSIIRSLEKFVILVTSVPSEMSGKAIVVAACWHGDDRDARKAGFQVVLQ